MHLNPKVSSTSVLGVVLATALFAATSLEAATVSGVSVTEGYGYTNVTVKATVSDVSGETLVFAVKNGSTVLKSVEQSAVSGENSCVIDLTDLSGSADKNKTYFYEVSVKDAAVAAGAYYSNVGWQTNDFFKADATTSPATYVKGEWAEAPEIEDSAFQIAGVDVTFSVTNNVAVSAANEIIDFQCQANIDSCYLLDDITNDVTGAIGGISLVTNDAESVAAKWMVLTNGTTWAEAAGADAVTNNYLLRMEVDYGADKKMVRYSVKTLAASTWSVLNVGGAEWVAASNNATSVSNVCFSGKSAVAKFSAKLSTKNVVEVNGTEYSDVATALNAYSGNKIVLFTNLAIAPTGMKSGSYAIEANGKTITPISILGVAPATEGGSVTYSDGTLTIANAKFVAELSSDGVFAKAGNPRYSTLAAAGEAVAGGETIFVLTNIAANTTFSKLAAFTLDLNGFALTKASAESPILTVDGEADLYLTGTEGGSITGTTGIAVCATNGASIAIDGIWVTNNTTAILAGVSSTVVISNGVFTGAFLTSGDPVGQINIVGGYLTGNSFGGATATGGKYVNNIEGVPASGYKYVSFALPVTTNGHTFAYEVMTNATASSSEDTKVWSVKDSDGNESIGGVQIPNDTMTQIAGSGWDTDETSRKAAQEALNTEVSYGTGTGTIKRWERAVLGMDMSTTTEGPCVKSVQDTKTDKISFSILSPEVIKAKESGCDVKFTVQAFTDPELTTEAAEGTSDKVDYDKTAEITAPTSGVRYYKLNVYISTKK